MKQEVSISWKASGSVGKMIRRFASNCFSCEQRSNLIRSIFSKDQLPTPNPGKKPKIKILLQEIANPISDKVTRITSMFEDSPHPNQLEDAMRNLDIPRALSESNGRFKRIIHYFLAVSLFLDVLKYSAWIYSDYHESSWMVYMGCPIYLEMLRALSGSLCVPWYAAALICWSVHLRALKDPKLNYWLTTFDILDDEEKRKQKPKLHWFTKFLVGVVKFRLSSLIFSSLGRVYQILLSMHRRSTFPGSVMYMYLYLLQLTPTRSIFSISSCSLLNVCFIVIES